MNKTAAPVITSLETKMGSAEPSCAIYVTYAGGREEGLGWADQPCDQVKASVVSIAKLEEMGQLANIPKDDLEDLRRLNASGVVLVESEFTASIYIIDRTNMIKEISLAD